MPARLRGARRERDLVQDRGDPGPERGGGRCCGPGGHPQAGASGRVENGRGGRRQAVGFPVLVKLLCVP